MKSRGQMGTNDERGRSGKGNRRKGQNRRKARTRLQMTDRNEAMMWSWEVRVRQMEMERRYSFERTRMTSSGKEPIHTQDALVQKLNSCMTNPRQKLVQTSMHGSISGRR